MKRLLTIAILVVLAQAGMAQQQYTFTNFLLNDYYYNPAIAGSKGAGVANLGYRNQWAGFDDAPVTLIGNYYGSLRNEGKHGYGASIISDRTGLTQSTGIYLNYAQHFKFTEDIKLGLGIQPGFMQYRVRLYDARLADPGDVVLTGNILSANAFDMSAGFHLYTDDWFFMGSIQHLFGESITFTTYNQNLARHFNIIGGYTFHLPKQKLDIQPSVLMKFVRPVPAQWSLMTKVTYDKKYWLGVSLRTDDAIGAVLGLKVKERFSVGYGYDYSTSNIASYQNGSHEVVLSFVITNKKPTLEDEDDKLNNSIMDELNKRLEEEKENND